MPPREDLESATQDLLSHPAAGGFPKLGGLLFQQQAAFTYEAGPVPNGRDRQHPRGHRCGSPARSRATERPRKATMRVKLLWPNKNNTSKIGCSSGEHFAPNQNDAAQASAVCGYSAVSPARTCDERLVDQHPFPGHPRRTSPHQGRIHELLQWLTATSRWQIWLRRTGESDADGHHTVGPEPAGQRATPCAGKPQGVEPWSCLRLRAVDRCDAGTEPAQAAPHAPKDGQNTTRAASTASATVESPSMSSVGWPSRPDRCHK